MISRVRPLGDFPLSRSALDRDEVARTSQDFLSSALDDPSTRVVRLRGGRLPIRADAIVFEEVGSVARPDPEEVVYLGRTLADEGGVAAGIPVLLLTEGDAPSDRTSARAADDGEWMSPRDVAHRLSDRDAGIAAEALAISNWHRVSRFCANCGAATSVRRSGWMRACPQCHAEHFPRTDPAVIVRIVHDDRILLGSSVLWPEGRYSLLAGFVEAGESLEAAVLREVHEESGMRLGAPTYLGSQPWPFPRSIMFGFHAELADGQDPADVRPDEDELADVRWFTRAELTSGTSDVTLPGSTSIARAIIDDWIANGTDPGNGADLSNRTRPSNGAGPSNGAIGS
ncbi:NAD(+) diphosphatase [Labedella populi]|uniref:NAD(+) diphosphatase n=1 Tax=Labedella populi TaxID=2498850 RepID=A0A444QDF5_9MICO|nr:NAD(+) diphosphatase [Labedella populi]RWZ64725.1 NAD(+) diphosphatase [Labedella populi]